MIFLTMNIANIFQDMRQNYKEISQRRKEKAKAEKAQEFSNRFNQPKVFEIQSASDFQGWGKELANSNNSTDKTYVSKFFELYSSFE